MSTEIDNCPNAWGHGNPMRYCPCGWMEPSPPRTWSLPPEPGPEVAAVRDAGGERWTLYEDGFWRVAQIRRRWGSLLAEFGPLTDATEDPA